MEGRNGRATSERQGDHRDRRRHRLVHVNQVEALALEHALQARVDSGSEDDVGQRVVGRHDHRATDRNHALGRRIVAAAARVEDAREPAGRIAADDRPGLDPELAQRDSLVLGVLQHASPVRPRIGHDNPDLHRVEP